MKLTASNVGGADTKTFTLTVKASKSSQPAEIVYSEGSGFGIYPEAHDVSSYEVNYGTDAPAESTSPEAISDEYIIIARLGRIEVEEGGLYDFPAVLDDDAPAGAELFCFVNADNPSEDDEIVEFFDIEGEEISAVPEDLMLTVSVWLNPGSVYDPVIAIKR